MAHRVYCGGAKYSAPAWERKAEPVRVLITRNSSNSDAVDASLMITAYLNSQDVRVTMLDAQEIEGISPKDFDLAVSLGGDGTMLHTANFARYSGLPILGLNFGHLGFLVNKVEHGVVAAVAAALSGDVVMEKRTNLRVDVLCEGDDEDAFDAGLNDASAMRCDRTFFGLNESAITRGASGKVIDFELNIASEHVADMRGDGLVIATATGSTAYALSAGGPLVAPGFGGLVVVPVAPHTLLARAIVTNSQDVLEANLGDNVASREATLFVDGNLMEFDHSIRKLRVSRGPVPTTVLQYKHEGFYSHASEVFFG